jgi:hypothetical protein
VAKRYAIAANNKKVMKRKLFLAAALLLCAFVNAQEAPAPPTPPAPPAAEKKFEAGFDGMIGTSYGTKTLGINVGGPSLKYRFTPKFKIGAGAFPSLIILDGKALPRLAVSPIVEYTNWMFITPYYGFDAKNKAIWTFGIGYKFI